MEFTKRQVEKFTAFFSISSRYIQFAGKLWFGITGGKGVYFFGTVFLKTVFSSIHNPALRNFHYTRVAVGFHFHKKKEPESAPSQALFIVLAVCFGGGFA